MNLKRNEWENVLKLCPEVVSIIAVENAGLLWSYCNDLRAQSEGGVGEFQLFDNTFKESYIARDLVVEMDITNIVLNNKRLVNAFVKKCSMELVRHKFQQRFSDVTALIYQLCKDIADEVGFGYGTVLNPEIDLQGMLKLVDVKFTENHTTLLEKLVEYINICTEFLDVRIFVFLFPSKFLTIEDVSKLQSHCAMQEVSLVFIEDSIKVYESSSLNSQAIIIDQDGYELTKNFDPEFDEIRLP